LAAAAGAAALGLAVAGAVLHKRIPLGRPLLLLDAYTGFAFFRHWQGKLSTGALVAISVMTLAVGGFAYWQNYGQFAHKDLTFTCALVSMTIAFAIFAGAYVMRSGFTGALRGPSLFVGRLTYSVYLVHPIVIAVLARSIGTPRWAAVLVPMVSIPLAMLTYEVVERRGIEIGRRLGKRAVAIRG
jgi:peptidoglycan/LPS O-acetylase OafA/YrhL